MENKTAKMCCFVKAYHNLNHSKIIFEDEYALTLLTKIEYQEISNALTQGIKFFNPSFTGTDKEALNYIVSNQLAPSVLGRSAFNERLLENEIILGCNQYLIFGSGYDTYAYRNKYSKLNIFEFDLPQLLEDKRQREKDNKLKVKGTRSLIPCDITNNNWINRLLSLGFSQDEKSYSSFLGLTYYLTKEQFSCFLNNLSNITKKGSSICFDYQTNESSKETSTNQELAKGANEEMKACYSYQEIEKLLEDNGYLIYEHLDHYEMNEQYFKDTDMIAPIGVSYILACKNVMD